MPDPVRSAYHVDTWTAIDPSNVKVAMYANTSKISSASVESRHRSPLRPLHQTLHMALANLSVREKVLPNSESYHIRDSPETKPVRLWQYAQSSRTLHLVRSIDMMPGKILMPSIPWQKSNEMTLRRRL
jgi:hypothetical protein